MLAASGAPSQRVSVALLGSGVGKRHRASTRWLSCAACCAAVAAAIAESYLAKRRQKNGEADTDVEVDMMTDGSYLREIHAMLKVVLMI